MFSDFWILSFLGTAINGVLKMQWTRVTGVYGYSAGGLSTLPRVPAVVIGRTRHAAIEVRGLLCFMQQYI